MIDKFYVNKLANLKYPGVVKTWLLTEPALISLVKLFKRNLTHEDIIEIFEWNPKNFINMKISPVLFATAIWLGMQDSFWMTTLKDGEDRKSLPQFEMKFYHYSRMWVYTFAFLSFVIEYLIKMFV